MGLQSSESLTKAGVSTFKVLTARAGGSTFKVLTAVKLVLAVGGRPQFCMWGLSTVLLAVLTAW